MEVELALSIHNAGPGLVWVSNVSLSSPVLMLLKEPPSPGEDASGFLQGSHNADTLFCAETAPAETAAWTKKSGRTPTSAHAHTTPPRLPAKHVHSCPNKAPKSLSSLLSPFPCPCTPAGTGRAQRKTQRRVSVCSAQGAGGEGLGDREQTQRGRGGTRTGRDAPRCPPHKLQHPLARKGGIILQVKRGWGGSITHPWSHSRSKVQLS